METKSIFVYNFILFLGIIVVDGFVLSSFIIVNFWEKGYGLAKHYFFFSPTLFIYEYLGFMFGLKYY